MKTTATLECFVKKDGKYLMLHRNENKRIMPGVWMAPGGKRDFPEGLFACARRQIMEETGLKIKNLRVWAAGFIHLKDLDEELYVHFLEADYAGGNLKENAEDGTLAWLTPDEIMKLENLLSEHRHVLPHLFNKNPHVVSFRAVYEKGNKMTEFELEESS